jgi:hypothetical protein
MSYILKNTSGLVNTRITDVGRRKLSEGNFVIKYFQIGDSEVSYDLGSTYLYSRNNILDPSFNEHNDVGSPESNKQNVKYPFYLQGLSGNTYGIPYMDSKSEPVYNTIDPKGFFSVSGSPYWYAKSSSAFTVNANYAFDLLTLTGGNKLEVFSATCSSTSGTPKIGDIVSLYITNQTNCAVLNKVYPVLTYKIQQVCSPNVYQLDRDLPNFECLNICGTGRTMFYPSKMTELYDTVTPLQNWNFFCEDFDVNIWNMNIPWSETPAGINLLYETYQNFGSVEYLGTKEYFGYGSTGGTVDTGEVFYYNSLGEKIVVRPEEQKAISIIHFTNNSTDNPYGEKFALEPYDPTAVDTTGQAQNFKIEIPWVMWHKSPLKTLGLTLYVDPPNDRSKFQIQYLKSTKNIDMNFPGIRYYHIWDNYNNRVGKLFPDSKIIIIDDEELIAALSYKSNRSWTLPAPKISLITPNVCDPNGGSQTGVLTGKTETLYVTYRFDTDCFSNSLHNNYYQKIQGPDVNCNQVSQNVSVQFGNEFIFMTDVCCPTTTTTTVLNNPNPTNCCVLDQGFLANKFKVIVQKVENGQRPDPSLWREIDFTDQLTSTMMDGYITANGMVSNTFVITSDLYDNAPYYDLSDYINLPLSNNTSNLLGFGDEYYFYGNVETDIQSTIYEMRYNINLANGQFEESSNPTWNKTITKPYFTEIGLYDENKNLLIINKMQSPVKREGDQQIQIKIDF